MRTQEKAILIVGGGIAGMAAALHIAEAGQRVFLIDEAAVIGGALLLLDKTFPTDSCGVCFMAPNPPTLCPFIECEAHPLIELLPNTVLTHLKGDAGSFEATLSSKPRFVDATRCTECGLCADVCPELVPSGHLQAKWLGEEHKAIYQAFPQAVPSGYVIDSAACTLCGACVDVCLSDAIDLLEEASTRTEEVAAVILASGFGPNDAYVRGAYGYGHYANVISSLEYERMLSTSSPSRGKAIRISDGHPAQRIAIIHCVGSRDQSCGVPYCSSTCCMIAAKQASLTKRRNPDAEIILFTMDLRATGRGYEQYLNNVRQQSGTIYRRSLVSGVKLIPQTQQLQLEYAENGCSQTDIFDLVVLEVGMLVPDSVQAMLRRIDVESNSYGFVARSDMPTTTSRNGVFVAGALDEPKDVPTTVAQSIAAAAQALAMTAPASAITSDSGESVLAASTIYDPPVIGIFFDGGDAELALTLDLQILAAQAKSLGDVVVVELNTDEDTLREAISHQQLTHIICIYRHAPHNGQRRVAIDGIPITVLALSADGIFMDRSCSEWANQKAFTLLKMTFNQVRLMMPQAIQVNQPESRALVLGAGAAGLMAAHTLSIRGIETHIIERNNRLGGWLIGHHVEDRAWLAEIIENISDDPKIIIHLNSELSAVEGRAGHQIAHITTPTGELEIPFGAMVIATGAEVFQTSNFAQDETLPIINQHELSQKIASWENDNRQQIPDWVVMIQCIAEKIGERHYCSRTCCVDALKNALALKALAPDMQITILFRDIVTPGFDELLYTEARRHGIMFLRYGLASPPQFEGKTVKILDEVLGETLALQPDLVVLSRGITPDGDTPTLAGILDLPLNEDGFFSPINIKAQPLDLPSPGMYLAGLAGGPATTRECIEQGIAAGLRAALFLRRGLKTSRTIATVNERICSACGLCVQVCPVGARSIHEATGSAQVDSWSCVGCGACVAICPNGASSQATMETRAVLASLEAALGD